MQHESSPSDDKPCTTQKPQGTLLDAKKADSTLPLVSTTAPTDVIRAQDPNPGPVIYPRFVGGELLKQAHAVSVDGDPNSWAVLEGSELNVRGVNYLHDHKKFPSRAAGLNVLGIDFVRSPRRIDNITVHAQNPLLPIMQHPNAPPFFIVNFQVAMNDQYLHLVIYSALPPDPPSRMSNHTLNHLTMFTAEGTPDAYRNAYFKLVPSVVVGPWLAKKAVGNKPALIGNKLTCRYFRSAKHFEVSVDVGSSVASSAILSVVKTYVKVLVVDLAFFLEGKAFSELPEQVLGGVRIYHADMDFLFRSAPTWH